MKPLKATLSIDRAVFSTYEHHKTPFDPVRLEDMSNYKLIKSYNQKDQDSNKYQTMSEFVHTETGLTLKICSGPRIRHLPPYLLCFNSSWNDKLKVQHVEGVEEYFRTLNMSLRCAEIHLAIDIHSEQKNAHNSICRSLKPGKKKAPMPNGTTLYFGAKSCPSKMAVYDKKTQLLEVKGIGLNHECTRIELRFLAHKLSFLPRSVQELADLDWSFVYDKYFSFYRPNKYLIEDIHKAFEETFAKELLTSPLWYLRDVITQEFEMPSHNFYRDYLEEVPELAEPVKKSLSKYRWRNKK